MNTLLVKVVSVALIATLALIFSTPAFSVAAGLGKVTPAKYPATRSTHKTTNYLIYLMINGTLVDCTANASYNENHVYYMGSLFGDRTGVNGETIVNGGQFVGRLAVETP